MRYRVLCLAALTATLLIGVLRADGPTGGVTQSLHCLVSLIDDVRVPAQQAGVMKSVEVKPGQQVTKGTLLARLDDNQQQMQRRIAQAEKQVAEEKAANDASILAAEAGRKVAETEYRVNYEANLKVAGTKTVMEMERLHLLVEQATLQIQQSRHEQTVAQLQVGANTARVEVTDDEIARRQIVAPIDGEVVEVSARPGEWVEPGNTVLRVVRLDRLRIEGFLNAGDVAPSDVRDRPVTVTVRLAQGRVETFQGQVVFVNPLIQAGGEYRIWAEVDNRRQDGTWILQPGYEAEMTIDRTPLAARGLPSLR